MAFSTPSNSQFERWFEEKYHIICNNENGWCDQNGKELFHRSSHIKNAFIFVSYEKTFKDEHGKTYILRALGIFNTIISVEEGKLWELLN